jgi:hypothetical protein
LEEALVAGSARRKGSPSPPAPLPEGEGSRKESPDSGEDALWMGEDVVVGQTEHGEPVNAEEGVARNVGVRRREVMGAVRFNDEAGLLAEKVDDVGAERLLSSKLRMVEAAASKQRPQGLLGRRRRSAKSASTEGRGAEQASHAPTSTRARPSCFFSPSSPLSLRERGRG